MTGSSTACLIILWTFYSHRPESRTKKRLKDIKKRLESLETLVEQQNDSTQHILELLQQQRRTLVAGDDRPTRPTVTFDAETKESDA